MSVYCSVVCSYNTRNEKGKCMSANCVYPSLLYDSIQQRNAKKHVQFNTPDGYFETTKDFCNFYGISIALFVEKLKQGLFWIDAFNECIAQRNKEQMEKQQKQQKAIKRAMMAAEALNIGNVNPNKDDDYSIR